MESNIRYTQFMKPTHTTMYPVNVVGLYLVCHFRVILVFDANLKRGHNDTNSTGKDKMIKVQLFSLSILKPKLNIDFHSKIVIQNRGLFKKS